MPILFYWGVLGVAALATGGYAADKVGDAVQGTTQPIKWLVTGGVVYVGYKALKSGGAIK